MWNCGAAFRWRELTSLAIGGTTDLLRINRHEAIPELLNLLDENRDRRTNFWVAARTCW